jgi:DNA replication protein DnaC
MKDRSIVGAEMSEKHFFEICAPKKFAHVTLEQCDKQPQSFHEYAKEWGKKPESVILLGEVGRGKTQFAFAMIREMFRRCPRRIWPRYYTSPEMDSMLLQASRSDDADKFKINEIGKEDLLFIDDFGRETNSERAKRQYFEVLNMRYAGLLPTLISTNLTLEQIGHHMNAAIASRFQEFQIIEFGGADLRIQRKIS